MGCCPRPAKPKRKRKRRLIIKPELRSEIGERPMEWEYGLTTVQSRRETFLPATLESLKAAGFDRPTLFLDGATHQDAISYEEQFKLPVVSRKPPNLLAVGNWVLALWEMYVRNTKADRYAIFQDDVVACKDLRLYLEKSPYPNKGYLNLYTFPQNQKLVSSEQIGWVETRQTGLGALGLVFDLNAVSRLLSQYSFAYKPRDPARPVTRIDGAVVEAMKKCGYREYAHNPSLLQHAGQHASSIGKKIHPLAKSFPGADFVATELLEKATIIKQNAPLPMKRPAKRQRRPVKRRVVRQEPVKVKSPMNAETAIGLMKAPGDRRRGKWLNGVIQILVTNACDESCHYCTQGSNLGGKPVMMTPEQFEDACISVKGYFGVVGVFGGNPAMHPQFEELCEIMRRHVPHRNRGLWCNNPRGKAKIMAETFNPNYSNLNVHMNQKAYGEFKEGWPQCHPVGLEKDSRHSPAGFMSMTDLGVPEEKRWELISTCDINQHWSALIGVFRGELRAWFCEVAGAQAMKHQYEEDYPDTGLDPTVLHNGKPWWRLGMPEYEDQVQFHCHDCAFPLRGHGELALNHDSPEMTTKAHQDVFVPKNKNTPVQLVTKLEDMRPGALSLATDYIGNSQK